jgi:hypothetical protein
LHEKKSDFTELLSRFHWATIRPDIPHAFRKARHLLLDDFHLLSYSFILKMEAVFSFKTPVSLEIQGVTT